MHPSHPLDVSIGREVYVCSLLPSRSFYETDHEKALRRYRDAWQRHPITGETRQAWHVHIPGGDYAILKREQLPANMAWSPEDVDARVAAYADTLWARRHASRIADCVLFVEDVMTLRQIADLVGYSSDDVDKEFS